MVGDFRLAFDSAEDLQRAWEDSLYRGEAFVPTQESPLLGASLQVCLAVTGLGEVVVEAEVLSLELDSADRPGMRISLGPEGREALRQLAASLPAPADDTARRVPLAATGTIPQRPDVAAADTLPHGSHAHFKPGEVIGGRFQVEALIGEGGMGEVYRAVHVYLKRPVALKTLQKKLLSDQEAWTRFQREAELVSRLESQHVVRVFDFGRLDDGQPFICMEFVEGEGLEAVLDRGPLEPSEAVTLLEQVAEGLSEAHALGIVHRDLKPPNIMLGRRRDGRKLAKILDFGIARVATSGQKLERLTATGMVVGTPAYLAPEQALGKDIDARTDIYALGCVAYEMLTGRPPFKADAIGALLLMHLNEVPRPLEAFRPQLAPLAGLSEAVRKALEKDPARRWQAVEDFTRALRDGLLPKKGRPVPRQKATPSPEASTDTWEVENLPVITAPPPGQEPPDSGTPEALPRSSPARPAAPLPRISAPSLRDAAPPPRSSAPPPQASPSRTAYGSPPSGALPPPRSSAPSLPRASSPPRSSPPPFGAIERSDALDGRLGRLGETLANLNFALSPERVAAMEKARAAVPETSTIGWVLVAEPLRTTHTQPAYASLLALAVDVATVWGGALDKVDEKLFTFLFVGAGSQARAVLAATEIRERIEVMLDGAPTDAPVFRLALGGGKMTPPQEGPLEGEVVQGAKDLAGKAGPGQVLLPSSFANAVSDLVETQAAGDAVAIVERRPFPNRPVPVVGRDLTLNALSERLAALAEGTPPPMVVVGPRLSGRSTMAQEAISRARAKGLVVGFSQGTRSLAGLPYAAFTDVICQLCSVVPNQRFTALAPVLERLQLTPGEREAVLLLTQVKPPLSPFTPKQAVHVLRRVLEAGSGGRPRVLVFDALDAVDEASAEAFRELCVTKARGELVLGFTSPEQADQWLSDVPQAPLPLLSSADVGRWLAAFLGHAAPRELQVSLEARSRGLPGLLVEWTLLAVERGLLRPRGSGLALEGALPAVEGEALPAERLKALGARVARLVEATAALGDAADTAVLARVLPGASQATWQRLQGTRLVKSAGGARVVPGQPGLEEVALKAPMARRPALWHRLTAALGETVKKAPMEWLRVARLVDTVAEPSRAAQAWRTAAAVALKVRSPLGLMHAQAGWAEALGRLSDSDTPDATRLRLELLARAAANAFVVRDTERARTLIDTANELAQREQVGAPEHFLLASRLHRSLGRPELAQEALSQALTLAGRGPAAALCLAEVGDVKESEGDMASAAQAYEQALPLADAAAPLAVWHGELDFRARVETRLAGVLMVLKDERAKALLSTSLGRWRAAGAPLYEARVLANLGTLCVAGGQLNDAAALFGQAAATAEAAGDFPFHARQLVSLARVQARAGSPQTKQTAATARTLAMTLGWDEGRKQAEALLQSE
ncbi:MAG: protein kinase [Myxococcales bacterium]|nr:protein kinase [Myxococcales bacterium]